VRSWKIDDEKGVMVFVLIGVVLLILSTLATAYFAKIHLQEQEETADTAPIKEINKRIERIERELENAAWEAGQKAVEKVQEEISRENKRATTAELIARLGENTTEIFENYFRENHVGVSEHSGYQINLSLRPLKEEEPHIEMIPIYIREMRGDEAVWNEVPGYFEVNRVVHVDIQEEGTGSFSTRKITLNRSIETDLFLLADRMDRFKVENLRRSIGIMTSAFLTMKIFGVEGTNSLDLEEGWYKTSFSDHFDTDWLEEYDGTAGGFSGGDERKVWHTTQSDDTSYLLGLERETGDIRTHELLEEEELEAIMRLALLLEIAQTFNSYDEELLEKTAESFDIAPKRLLEYLGSGVENRVNLEALVIGLFQEEGTLSECLLHPGPFLNRTVAEGFLSMVDKDENWVNTGFGMTKRLFQGDMLEEDGGDRWSFEDLFEKILHPSKVPAEKSYLRSFMNFYSNIVHETLDSFDVDGRVVEEKVEEDIKNLGPLPWMIDLEIIGEGGVEKTVDSILHTSRNLSLSLGFEEGNSNEEALPFYFIYFLSDWGIEEKETEKNDARERLNTENMQRVIEGKIRNELNTRKDRLRNTADEEYYWIYEEISYFNETIERWDEEEREGWKEVWGDLNNTLSYVKDIYSGDLFDEASESNTTQLLDENYDNLEERSESVKRKINGWGQGPKEYTFDMIETQYNFTRNDWTTEVYEFLLRKEEESESEDALEVVDSYINARASDLTENYDWTLENYDLSDDIDIPPKNPKESIGYAALGNFTEDLKREFLAPLEYSTSYQLFERINQNVFDLVGQREDGSSKHEGSRLWNILRGEGDPYTEYLNEVDPVRISYDVGPEDVHSSDISEIDHWFVEGIKNKSLERVSEVKEALSTKTDYLERDSELEPQSRGDASFYRGAEILLDGMTTTIENHMKRDLQHRKVSGLLNTLDGVKRRLPIYDVPMEGLTIWSNKSIEHSRSQILDLDVTLSCLEDVIQLEDIEESTVKEYDGDILSAKEWMNPFSEEYQDFYNSVSLLNITTSDIEMEVEVGDDRVLGLEKFSSDGLKRTYESREHEAVIETLTPMPLLNQTYKPSSMVEHEIKNFTLDRNVFNETEKKANFSFEVKIDQGVGEKTGFSIEISETDYKRTVIPSKYGKSLYYSDLETQEMKDNIFFEEYIEIKGRGKKIVNLSFELDNADQSEFDKSRLSIMIRPSVRTRHLKRSRELEQNESLKDDIYLSQVPSYTSSEQIFFVEEKNARLSVFDLDHQKNSSAKLDFIDKIPPDSWVIEKDGMPFKLDFEDIPEYRAMISGEYGRASQMSDIPRNIETFLGSDISEERLENLPKSDYRFVLENHFVPVYMAISCQEIDLYPVEVLPILEDGEKNQRMWESFEERMVESGRIAGFKSQFDDLGLFNGREVFSEENRLIEDPGFRTAGYIYYDGGNYHGPEKAQRAFESIEHFGRSFDKIQVRREEVVETIGFEEESEKLRKADVFDEFLTSNRSKREELFLAASIMDENLEDAAEIQEENPSFSLDMIGKSLELLGEDRTKEIMVWFEENRGSDRSREFEAFLSFEEVFLKDLQGHFSSENCQKEALDELDENLSSINMDFREARTWGVKDISDIEAIDLLRKNFQEDSILDAVSYGVSPAALEKLSGSEYDVDIDKFVISMEKMSNAAYFQSFIEEINSETYTNLPSFYLASKSNRSDISWMPFGEGGPPLLVEDRLGSYNMSNEHKSSIEEISEMVNETISDSIVRMEASEDELGHQERALVMIDITYEDDLDEEERGYLEEKVKEASKYYCPDYRLIGEVEIKLEDENDIRYLHL